MQNVSPLNKGDAEIRERVDTLVRAMRAKDVNTVMTHYAPEVVAFDFAPPLQVEGAAAYRMNFEQWFAGIQGPIDYELEDLNIAVADRAAFTHNIGHVKCASLSGEKIDYRVRVTACFQKLRGQWLITHEHISMPTKM
jgi:ketosteroid isomerase-like protein